MDIRTKRLRKAFDSSGYTQAELCSKTGINKGALSSYLSGNYFPKQRALDALSRELHVSITYLMGFNVDTKLPDVNASISQKLIALRDRDCITQKELADILNVSKSIVSDWELGKSLPNNAAIDDLAVHFHVEPSYLSGSSFSLKERMVSFFELLNEDGQNKAFQYIQDLSELDKYKRQV